MLMRSLDVNFLRISSGNFCEFPFNPNMLTMLKWKKVLHYSHLQVFVLIWLILFNISQAQIPINSKLFVDQSNTWVSYNGDFAIGFFQRTNQSYKYSVGIRFNSKSIPASKQTVVWVAGADVAVGNTSFFHLTSDGNLVLFDSSNEVIVWTSETSHMDVVSAILRDDGNLILINGKNNLVWQTFDYPSDTLLPGQNFHAHMTLRAARRNAVSSYYNLHMNASGQLQLRWNSDVIFWSSGSFIQSNVSAVLTSGGAFQLVKHNLQAVWSVFGDDNDAYRGFRFLRLDVDGNLRMYSWIQQSESWKPVWQAVENQCKVFATCEHLGICSYNAAGSAECHCPYHETSDPESMCLTRSCEIGSSMITYEHTFLYGVYPINDTVIHSNLNLCKTTCERDPSCIAATFTNDGTGQCRIKTTPFFSGYLDPSIASMSFVKKCSDPLAADPTVRGSRPAEPSSRHPQTFCLPCLLKTLLGTLIAFAALQLVICYVIYRRRNQIWKKAELVLKGYNSKGLMMLSRLEIEDITEKFSHQIGPKMFKGMLPNHTAVAVKELDLPIDTRKFRALVSKIGSIHHRNLVKLEGYCFESDRRFLVYEFLKPGPLNKAIEDDELSKKLTWKVRVEICLGIGRAICYLHTGCREFVCHGNLKSGNVLLDKNLDSKVSEFGFGLFTTVASYGGEKDVEDFGKIMLELLGGYRDNMDDFCLWSYDEWFNGHPENVVDQRIVHEVDFQVLERALRITFWCLQDDKRLRPSMDEVVKVLEGVLQVDPPPPPFAGRRLSLHMDSNFSGESTSLVL